MIKYIFLILFFLSCSDNIYLPKPKAKLNLDYPEPKYEKQYYKKYYNFDLWGMHEAIQLTHYNSPGGKYDQHVDKGYQTQIRKLSVCVQLSEPDSYEGGDLIINQGKENKMKRDLGYAVIFPSWTLHKVTAMKKGERWSLVSWIAGPNFR